MASGSAAARLAEAETTLSPEHVSMWYMMSKVLEPVETHLSLHTAGIRIRGGRQPVLVHAPTVGAHRCVDTMAQAAEYSAPSMPATRLAYCRDRKTEMTVFSPATPSEEGNADRTTPPVWRRREGRWRSHGWCANYGNMAAAPCRPPRRRRCSGSSAVAGGGVAGRRR